MIDLSGKTALITGASSGLGATFARAYAANGADLVLVARRKDRLNALAEDLSNTYNIQTFVIAQDLSDVSAPSNIMHKLGSAEIHPDILVNNAGFTIPDRFSETDWSRQEDLVMTMVMAVTSLTHELLPGMMANNWGRVINISSTAAFAPGGVGHTLYPAAKAYVLRFSQSLHEELRDTGINVTAICPGSTATEFSLANGMCDASTDRAGWFVQSADQVVRSSLRANEANKPVLVSGLHNKIGVAALRLLPDWVSVRAIRWGQKRAALNSGIISGAHEK